ncbi:MAG: hypothetical protein ACKVU1_13375 [bacterium]
MLRLWALLLLAIACDDSSSPAPMANAFAQRLAGDYTAQTDSLGGATYWMRVGAGGISIELIERGIGIRTMASNEWEALDEDAGIIRIGGTGPIAMLSGNDSLLVLQRTDGGDSLVFTRTTVMPDPESWLGTIEVLAQFDAPDLVPTDFAWDGTGILFPGRVLGIPIQRMNPAMNMQIDLSIPVSHSGNAVAYTPECLWGDDWLERRLYKLDGVTGETRLATRFVGATAIRGLSITSAGAVCISSANTIHVFDASKGVIDSVDLFQPAEGLENIGDVTYAALGASGIARIEGPPWRAKATYALAGLDVHGLAFDGTYWWLSVIDRRGATTTRVVRARLIQ